MLKITLLSSFFSLFMIFITSQTNAQNNFEFDPSIPVISSGNALDNAWAGGLNCAQVSDFDFDFDGDLDLFIFDRSRDNIRVLLQKDDGSGPYYEFLYNSKLYFPEDLFYRAQMIDYDNDGKKDLFTNGTGGIKVYRNVGSAVTGIQWELASELLYSQYPNNYTNLYVNTSDIPAIIDVDLDGDIDILTFHQGGQHVEYHQNQSMELYGIPDSLIFEVKNECWGLFTEEFSTNVLILNDPNVPCVGGSIPNPLRETEDNAVFLKHAGSTLLALDYDGSGVLDLVIGDVSYPSMTLLINGGTAPNTNSAMISQDNNFPSNTTPVNVVLFPAAFYVDVDFDNVKDLVVAPNARNISENVSSIRFYKNLGTNSNPTFTYVANNLFQRDMIEHGSGSIPVLFDYDQDGLQDLFVSNFYRYKDFLDRESTIAYYKNTGTSSAPQFTFVDNNFLNLNQLGLGLRLVPTFGDLDNDNDPDLIIGRDDGTIAYFENIGSVGSPSFATPILNYTDNNNDIISSGAYAFPQLFDLNKDNLLDLIIGKRNGQIAYYQNTGTIDSPEFTLMNDTLGSIDVSVSIPDGYATPHFFRIGDTTKLFIGNYDGDIILFDSVDNHILPGDTFNLVSMNYSGINVEGYSSISVNDIDNDNELNAFVGQDLGGLFAFEGDPNSSAKLELKEQINFICYPNPTNGKLYFESDRVIKEVLLYDLNGKELLRISTEANTDVIDISDLSPGIYLLYGRTDDGSTVNKKISKY
ncbi:MAG: T9SS type A sorting domain-containing protein [Bacteroidetes bacterium]|nr:MAG: T9SS type A sorting domain-containing protein [Bacteroidota bacterium]